MAKLRGYAIRTLAGRADHTYVKSSAGHVWPCFGRGAGGKLIAHGDGDADFADCLSEPDSTAGIDYLSTGVCHQAANRILYPARAIVSRAKGFRVSAYFFGVYGLGAWPELERCLEEHGR
jgi:hypothetical protein